VNVLLLAATTYIANLQRTHGALTQEHDRTLREKEDEIAALIDRHPDGKALKIKDAQIGRMKDRRRQYKMTKRMEREVLDEEHTELRNEKSMLEQEKQKVEEERKKLEEEKRELEEQRRRRIEEDGASSGS
jgi:DNA-directed RNA polymerase